MQNLYEPSLWKIVRITDETPDIKTFRLEPHSNDGFFSYRPGQFVVLSVFGEGEAPFCLTSSPTRTGFIECSVKKMGTVTQALHELSEGDTVGIRGPLGNSFPLDRLRGKRLLFVAGGIGLAPLRSVINNVFDERGDFGPITIVIGARTPADLPYKEEYQAWQSAKDVQFHLTVDVADNDWKGNVGVVTKLLRAINPLPEDTFALTCGPPIMIRFVVALLLELGFAPSQVITTLEKKMKCGVGICGRCNIAHLYVCKDGPVFSYEQIHAMTEAV